METFQLKRGHTASTRGTCRCKGVACVTFNAAEFTAAPGVEATLLQLAPCRMKDAADENCFATLESKVAPQIAMFVLATTVLLQLVPCRNHDIDTM